MPCCSAACRAPATISAGPRSPPMASTATGSGGTLSSSPVPASMPAARYSTMMACRPPYHPQLWHTTWGSLARRHCGHVLRGGAARLHAPARRLRLLAFDVFFFGTAIGAKSLPGLGQQVGHVDLEPGEQVGRERGA